MLRLTARMPGILLILALAGPATVPAQSSDQAPVVTVCHPLVRDANAYEFVGRIEPDSTVQVRALTNGTVKKITVRPGDPVKKGDLLIEIAAESLQRALADAESDLKREQDRVTAAGKTLQNALKAEKGKFTETDIEKLLAERNLAEATLDFVRAEIKRLRRELDDTRVTSPIDGRVCQVHVTENTKLDGSPRAAALLLTLGKVDPVKVTFDVDERTHLHLKQLALDGKLKADEQGHGIVRMDFPGEQEFRYQGVVDCTDNRFDPATKRIRVQAKFRNADDQLTKHLLTPEKNRKPVCVRLDVKDPRKVTLVPTWVPATDARGNSYVPIVNSMNVVEMRKVTLGALADGYQIIEVGLSVDDWIVLRTAGEPVDEKDQLSRRSFVENLRLRGIKPGMKVEPAPTKLQNPSIETRRPNP